jgi:hypothetical protein
MKLDLKPLVAVLRKEGAEELRTACIGKLGALALQKEFNRLLTGLEKLTRELSEGKDARRILESAKDLGQSAAALSVLASQILSFVPGPVGMVCSAINAVICLCTLPFPANLGNAFLELLGCIPGGKVASKGVAKGLSKTAPLFEKAIKEIISNNAVLHGVLKGSNEICAPVKQFANRIGKSVHTSGTGAKTAGKHLDIGGRPAYQGPFTPQSMHEGQQMVRRHVVTGGIETRMGNPVMNPYSHIW